MCQRAYLNCDLWRKVVSYNRYHEMVEDGKMGKNGPISPEKLRIKQPLLPYKENISDILKFCHIHFLK